MSEFRVRAAGYAALQKLRHLQRAPGFAKRLECGGSRRFISDRALARSNAAKARIVVLAALSFSVTCARADVLDFLGLRGKSTNQPSASQSGLNSLSQDQVVQGLKDALGQGVQQAVGQLGHDGGFLTNLSVRITMPEKLRAVEKTLRKLKQDTLADEFVATMNHAAEQAVPVATPVFIEAIKTMSIEDAKAILTGPNDAATQYFQRVTRTNLHEKFLPIVKTATDKTGVTSTYKKLMDKLEEIKLFGSLGEKLISKENVDIDAYVTDKALDGLFVMVAAEEKRIRQNANARTTDVMQKVFGALKR